MHSLPSGMSCTVSRYSRYLRRLTIFFTATIHRGGIDTTKVSTIPTTGIDDKYRGIVGIAQHYIMVHDRGYTVQFLLL